MNQSSSGAMEKNESIEHIKCGGLFLRYESSTLILYKELSSPIFQSCHSVSESVRKASVTPVQISILCNI